MPLSGEASGLAEEVPSPTLFATRSPLPLNPLPVPANRTAPRGPQCRCQSEKPGPPRPPPGCGPRRGRSRSGAHPPPPHPPRPASPRRGPAPHARPGPAPPGRPRPRRPAGGTPLPRGGGPGPAQTSRRVSKGVTDGPAPSAIPPHPLTPPRPRPRRRLPPRLPKLQVPAETGPRSAAPTPPAGAPEFTSKSRPLFLKFLSRWLSSFSLSAMAGAGDSFPRPGPAGSAPTTTPHRHSQEPGRRRCARRAAAASFLLCHLLRPPRPSPLPTRPAPPPSPHRTTAAPAKTTAGPGGGGGNRGGMCCRLRGGGGLDRRAPAPRPRPSPPAWLADWPAGPRRARPIRKDDGERGRKRGGKGEARGAVRKGVCGKVAAPAGARRGWTTCLRSPENWTWEVGREGRVGPGSRGRPRHLGYRREAQ